MGCPLRANRRARERSLPYASDDSRSTVVSIPLWGGAPNKSRGTGCCGAKNEVLSLRELELMATGELEKKCREMGVATKSGGSRRGELDMKRELAGKLGLATNGRGLRTNKIATWFEKLSELREWIAERGLWPARVGGRGRPTPRRCPTVRRRGDLHTHHSTE